MPLKDILKKRDKIKDDSTDNSHSAAVLPPPEFKFIRSDTHTEELISPPSFPDHPSPETNDSKSHKLGLHFRRSSRNPPPKTDRPITPEKQPSRPQEQSSPASTPEKTPKSEKRLSSRLEKFHIGSSSRSRSPSVNVPENLPSIQSKGVADGAESTEAEWEKRATLLAQGNQRRSRSPSVVSTGKDGASDEVSNKGHNRKISGAEEDVNIQEAIRLHEAGELEKSTEMFGKLADPRGENNALAQVLYGLSLRHGWGIAQNSEMAVGYLSTAASNSAAVEEAALASGVQKGGAAKGELVLAIYELGNSFRHGWGVDKDPVAARQYYETAANLGDVDAMGEVAWCLLEGFGGKKDKFKAAQYLRRAEEKGSKQLGNSWIWKEKYNPR